MATLVNQFNHAKNADCNMALELGYSSKFKILDETTTANMTANAVLDILEEMEELEETQTGKATGTRGGRRSLASKKDQPEAPQEEKEGKEEEDPQLGLRLVGGSCILSC